MDRSPHWGNRAYAYIEALTNAIAALEAALRTISTAPEVRILSAVAFWSTINDPETIASFYSKMLPTRSSLSKVVSAFMHKSPMAVTLCQEYWRKNARGISLKILVRQFLQSAPSEQYPTGVPVIYIYHQKHVFMAQRLKNRYPDLHAICRSEDIKVDLPIIKLPKPTITDLVFFMKQYPYPENIARQYCSMQILLKKMKIERLLTIEGTSPLEITTVLAAASQGIKTVCVQYGWPPYLHAGFRNLPYHSFSCWGAAFQKKLALYNPNVKFLEEGYLSEYAPVSVVCQKQHHFQLLVALQGPVGYIQPEHWSLFLELINTLSMLPIDIWVKEHPQIKIENTSLFKNVTFYTGDGAVQQALLKEADAVLGIYSSSMIEAPLFDCIPVIFNPTDIPSIYSEITEYEVGIECRTKETVLQAIERLILPENKHAYLKNMRRFRGAFFNERSQ